MCESSVLDSHSPQSTDFSSFFPGIKPLLEQSDIVIGNMETVFAGEALAYSDSMYSYNTPDSFLEAIRDLPVDIVTTANNHALDRGLQGLERTLEVLDDYGIRHTGTCAKGQRTMLVFDVASIKLALLAYTSTTNFRDHKQKLPLDREHQINLLCPQDYWVTSRPQKSLKYALNRFLLNSIGHEALMKMKKRLGRAHNAPYEDNLRMDALPLLDPFLKQVALDIEEAKGKADLVIVCPHMGGQFNADPGSFSEYYMKHFLKCGADLVVANHPHIIQRCGQKDQSAIFYCLGNFSLSPRSTYLIWDNRPDIGLILHVDIGGDTKQVQSYRLAPVRMRYGEDGFQVVPLIDTLIENEYQEMVEWLQGRLQVRLQKINAYEFEIEAFDSEF